MELWDLYTMDRIPTGQTMVRGTAQPPGTYRLVIHICIFSEEGKMLIQQRTDDKPGFGGYWDMTVGGSVTAGETSREAAERELREELGISLSFKERIPSLTLSYADGFDDIYLVRADIDPGKIVMQEDEVQAVRYADENEILQMMGEGKFIPYHPSLIDLLFFLKDYPNTKTAQSEENAV